jgi:hypothetical protein
VITLPEKAALQIAREELGRINDAAQPSSSQFAEIMRANRRIAGKTCPICRSEIKLGEEVRNCLACGLPHHLACWTQNGGCSAYGCPSAPAAQQSSLRQPKSPSWPETPPEAIYCPKCGQRNASNNFKCMRCSTILHEQLPPARSVTVAGDGLSSLIPYKNAAALWAYYLGIAALIPCVGIPVGIAALVMGLRGLKFARLNPEARGKVHAWVGIILGSLCAVVYSLILILMSLTGAFR